MAPSVKKTKKTLRDYGYRNIAVSLPLDDFSKLHATAEKMECSMSSLARTIISKFFAGKSDGRAGQKAE